MQISFHFCSLLFSHIYISKYFNTKLICMENWEMLLPITCHDDVMKWKHFRVTGPLWGEFAVTTGEFPTQMPVTRSFDIFFDLRLNKRLSKPSRRRWFETPSCSLWRHCSVYPLFQIRVGREVNVYPYVMILTTKKNAMSFNTAWVASVLVDTKRPTLCKRHF